MSIWKKTNSIFIFLLLVLIISSSSRRLDALTINDYSIKSYAGTANFSLYVNNSNDLYAIGENGCGQLGTADAKSHFDPQLIMSDVKDVYVGPQSFVFAVKNSGELYAWGKNQHCELGLGGEYNDDSDSNYYDKPQKVNISFEVKQIACGAAYALILDTNGNVYAAGSNQYGQLGISSTYKKKSVVETFTKVEGLSNIIQIAAADYTSYALDSNGFVYSFGDNYYGELGINSDVKDPNDSQINKLNLTNITKISAADCNAMALDSTGKVYIWGRNQNSQLGLEEYSDNFVNYPLEITSVVGKDIKCSGNTNFIISQDSYLYAFGANNDYNCGIDGETIITKPTKVNFFKALDIKKLKEEGADEVTLASAPVDTDELIDVKIASFVGGCVSRTFVLDTNGEVWSFGNNSSTQLCTGNTATSKVPVKSTLYRITTYDGEYIEVDYLTGPIIFLCIVFGGLIVFIVFSEIKLQKRKKYNKTEF